MRVEAESGFVLHVTPYRETSLLVDLFTSHQGRIRCVAKGFRKPNKRGISRALFPYTEYQFSWQGRSDLKTLTSADALGAPVLLQRETVFTGLYINELLYRLLHEQDPHEYLYQQYRHFVNRLSVSGTDELLLRRLEMLLLDELGYGLVLDADIQGVAIAPDRQYQYIPEQGLVELINQQKAKGLSLQGADLVSMVNGDFSTRSVMQAAKQLTRRVIDFYLGGKQLHSRELYRQHLMTASVEQNNNQYDQGQS
jgi:DNA repair protein RecO (recombination protein O)